MSAILRRAPLQLQVKVQGAAVAVKHPTTQLFTPALPLLIFFPWCLFLNLHGHKVLTTVVRGTPANHSSSLSIRFLMHQHAVILHESRRRCSSKTLMRHPCNRLLLPLLLLLLLLLKVTHLLFLVPICYQSASNRSSLDVTQWNLTGGGAALWM